MWRWIVIMSTSGCNCIYCTNTYHLCLCPYCTYCIFWLAHIFFYRSLRVITVDTEILFTVGSNEPLHCVEGVLTKTTWLICELLMKQVPNYWIIDQTGPRTCVQSFSMYSTLFGHTAPTRFPLFASLTPNSNSRTNRNGRYGPAIVE